MKIILDAGLMGSRKEAHAYLKEAMNFPEYYGNNLDALYDCLTELEDTEVEFLNTDQAEAYFEKVERVFHKAEERNPGLKVFEKKHCISDANCIQ